MNTNTGHLVTNKTMAEMYEDERSLYEEVPERLTLSAQLELAGRDEAYVGKKATSRIAKWARSKRNRLKMKAKTRKKNKLCCQ